MNACPPPWSFRISDDGLSFRCNNCVPFCCSRFSQDVGTILGMLDWHHTDVHDPLGQRPGGKQTPPPASENDCGPGSRAIALGTDLAAAVRDVVAPTPGIDVGARIRTVRRLLSELGLEIDEIVDAAMARVRKGLLG